MSQYFIGQLFQFYYFSLLRILHLPKRIHGLHLCQIFREEERIRELKIQILLHPVRVTRNTYSMINFRQNWHETHSNANIKFTFSAQAFGCLKMSHSTILDR